MLLTILGALLPLASSFCFDSWPNGTAAALNFWNCGGTPVTFLDVGTYLTDGQTHTYPVSLQKAILFKTKIVNSGPSLSVLQSTISLATYGGNDPCYWSIVPTYGSLDDKTPCADSFSCPIPSGSQELDITIDFTKSSPSMLQMLGPDSDVQMQYRLLDSSLNVKACLVVQMRMDNQPN